MNNSTVNKIISTIQFTIYSLFAFILSMIILSYAILSYGINIPHINLPNFKAEQLYIKLDKKLILHVKRIDVTLSNDMENTTPIFELPKPSPIIDMARNNFEYLYIDELNIQDMKVTFRYTHDSDKPVDNRFTINSDEINASLSYTNYGNYVNIKIEHFIHIPSKVSATGSSIYDFKEDNSYSKLIFSLSDSADVTVYVFDNEEEVTFTASSNVFTDLGPIVKLFNFDDGLYKWIVPYNKASTYQLLEAKGTYSYTDNKKLLNTLYLHAKEKDLSFTFQKGLSTVDGLDADVYFTKGILDIQPHKVSYNQHKINKGGVLIDFNGKDVILSIDLFADIKLTQDIVDILESYDIPLPLLQKSGKTDAHVKIFVNLGSREAYATGQFFIKESNILLEGIEYNVKNASVRLNKSILSIDTVLIKHKDIFTSHVHGQIDLKDVVGDVYFDTKKVNIPLSKNNDLILTSKNAQVRLHFTKDTESYILPKTQWSFDGTNIELQESQVFLKEKFSSILLLKDLQVSVEDFLDLNTSGFYNLADEYAVLDINLSKLNYTSSDFNLSKESSSIPLKLTYKDNQLDLSLLAKNSFLINQAPLHIQPTDFILKDGYLDTNNAIVSYNKQLHSYISTHFKLGSTSIKLKAKNTVVHNHDTLYIKPSFDILYHYVKQEHYLDIPKYNIHATLNKEGETDIEIRDLKKIVKHSNTLKKYQIKEGTIDLTYIDNNIGVDINLKDFYPLLSESGKNIKDYSIKGTYKDGTANLQINNKIDFLYRKKGKLTAKNIDFNFFDILSYIKLIKSKDKENSLDLILKTQKCNITLGDSGRKLLADTINVQVKGDKVFAQLLHNNGAVLFEGTEKNFAVHAQGLNDKFMNELFKFSTFTGGDMSFVIEGSVNDLTGIVNIKNSTIEDYTILNNTLAFFNTIPALVTFSVPGYSKEGLKVKEMYGSFHKVDHVVKINEAKIISKELVITAKGQTDTKKEDIDLLMQVKTDIGSSAKNIPIIGYIIFGDDSISTTVKVHGPLTDPIVESSVGKSVIVAPYNILKRALIMPFQAFGLFEDDDNSTKE